MRRLFLHRSSDSQLDASIYVLRRQRPLLQNLQHLTAYFKPHMLRNISPFLGPKLLSLTLLLVSEESAFESMSFLASLKIQTPSLEHLYVSVSCRLSSVVCGTVCSLKHLRTLHISNIHLTSECIDNLSVLSSLTELDVTITEDGLKDAASAAGREISFSSLLVLTISTDTWAIANDFCEVYLRPSSLENIIIQVREVPSCRRLHELFTAMRGHCSPTSLKHIQLCPEMASYVDSPPDPVLEPNTLRLLFAFSNLEELNIYTMISFVKVDNALIKDIASAWPHLGSLALRSFHDSGSTGVTIDGLLPLASCNSLKVLCIGLDPTIWQMSTSLRPGNGVCNRSLACLRVGKSPVTDPYAVASFLSDVFPNLKQISEWEHCSVDEPDILALVERWELVRNLYHHFVNIRMQERCWAASADR